MKDSSVLDCLNRELVDFILKIAQQRFGNRELFASDNAGIHPVAQVVQPLFDGLRLLLRMSTKLPRLVDAIELFDHERNLVKLAVSLRLVLFNDVLT